MDEKAKDSLPSPELAYIENEPNTGLHVIDTTTGKEVVDDTAGLQVIDDKNEKTVVSPTSTENQPGLEALTPENARRSKAMCGLSRRSFLILLLLAIIVIIGAVVGGAVGGTVGKSKGSGPKANVGATNSTAPFGTDISASSSLASVSWADLAGVTHYRIYYLNSQNFISELSWKSGDASWQINEVTNSSINVRTNSPISAIIGYPGDDASKPIQVNIWFVNSQNFIRELFHNTSSPDIWLWGASTNQLWRTNEKTQLAVSTRPAAIYWQDANNSIIIGNFTSRGWTSYALPGSPIQGSPIATVPVTQVAPFTGVIFFIQSTGNPSTDHVQSIHWTQGNANDTSGWSGVDDSGLVIPEFSGLTAFPTTQGSVGGNNTFVVATASSQNPAVSITKESDGIWSKSLRVSDQQSTKSYGALSSTEDGQLFAVYSNEKGGTGIVQWSLDASGNFVRKGMLVVSNKPS